MRLVGGKNRHEGRVEIYHDGVWGTVCVNGWGTNNAEVVCKDLGFPSRRALPTTNAFFGPGSDPTWLDGVRCTGSEDHLYECSHRGWGVEYCDHIGNDNTGVICKNGTLLFVLSGSFKYKDNNRKRRS